MYNLILGIVIVLSIVMVIAIMMQPSKQNSAASAFTGGADQLFGKQKAHAAINCSHGSCLDDLIICPSIFIFEVVE